MKRNTDGTWRNARDGIVVSEATIRTRWVEAETIKLKNMGLSYDLIAEQITRVGRGQAQAMVPIPEGLTFPPDYSISKQACHRRFQKAIGREPTLELAEMRKVDNARSEDMFANLQPAIRKGNPRAIEVGIKLLDHEDQINGYGAARKHELTGKDGKPLTLVQLLAAIGPISDEDEE